MIQRIQSVYLLLVAILLVVALCLPVGQFIGPDGIAAHIFKPLGVTLADGNFQSTLHLPAKLRGNHPLYGYRSRR